MKAEDRIIELLAEHVQKTDRLLDRSDRLIERMEKTDRNVDTMSRTIVDHSLKHIEMNAKFNEMKEEQGVMLKELLSISRRVSTLEDKS